MATGSTPETADSMHSGKKTDAEDLMDDKYEYLPGLFHQADDAAQQAQNRYVRLTAANLGMLVASAITFIYDFPAEGTRQFLAYLRAVLLLFSLLLTGVLDSTKPDRAWHQTRYSAEEVRSLAWRYMTGVPPPSSTPGETPSLPVTFSDLAYLAALRNLKPPEDLPPLSKSTDHLAITERMKQIREKEPMDRHQIYLEYRVKKQQEWYVTRHKYYLRNERIGYHALMACQLLAIISAFLKGANMSIEWDVSGLLATVAAAALAWVQVRQYQRLGRTYELAARELGYLQLEYASVSTAAETATASSERRLQELVNKGEQIIGEEYKEWRRRQEVD